MLRKRFQKLMQDLEPSEKVQVNDLKEKILSRVFYYTDNKEGYDVEIQMGERNSKSEC